MLKKTMDTSREKKKGIKGNDNSCAEQGSMTELGNVEEAPGSGNPYCMWQCGGRTEWFYPWRRGCSVWNPPQECVMSPFHITYQLIGISCKREFGDGRVWGAPLVIPIWLPWVSAPCRWRTMHSGLRALPTVHWGPEGFRNGEKTE